MGDHTSGCGKRNGWGDRRLGCDRCNRSRGGGRDGWGTVDWGVADATGREAMGGGP
jgi:hypothetical protein